MEKGLLEKTGKSLEHWIEVVKTSQLEKHKAIMDFLKSEHGFTHGFANFVALKARKADAASHDAEDLVSSQYKGKEHLKPIYDKLIAEISAFGDDITRTPKKSSVSMIRKKQFALIKPATKTRIDLGLKLKGKPTTDRLGNSGPFGSMCTHRVQLTAVEQVDEELMGWIREAYEMGA
jgi:predicted transport protein